jgi:exopolyphosphatase/guanosine-5'-triphosphate,3'-diphosphate pyrophosphatase
MIRAAIDIGSNTTLFLVAKRLNNGNWQLRKESLTTNGLGREMTKEGSITPSVQKRNLEILRQLVEQANTFGAQEIRAVGTAALRKAFNNNEFVDYIKKGIGLEINIISGQEEAQLTYRGAMVDFQHQPGRYCVIDIGGGSSEIVFGKGAEITQAWSLPLGAVSLTQSKLTSQPLSNEQKTQILQLVQQEVESVCHRWNSRQVRFIAVGGTAATLAALKVGVDLSELWKQAPISIPYSTIENYWRDFAGKSVSDIAKIPHLPQDRAGIITAGTAILLGIMQKLSIENIILSNKGLRWGLLMDDK